jgi:hypothetical protein
MNKFDETHYSTSNELTLSFKSTLSFTTQGFKARWKAIPVDTSGKSFGIPDSTHTHADIVAEALLHLPPAQAPPTCSCGEQFYFGAGGVITSPNYPHNHCGNLSCQYQIRTEPGLIVQMMMIGLLTSYNP